MPWALHTLCQSKYLLFNNHRSELTAEKLKSHFGCSFSKKCVGYLHNCGRIPLNDGQIACRSRLVINTRYLRVQLLDLYQTYTISTPVKLRKHVIAFFHNPSQRPDMDSPMWTFLRNLMKHVPIAHCTKNVFLS